MTLTQDLGRFAADVSFERLPQGAADVARIGFIDCIATMIAGAGDAAPQLLRKALQPLGGEANLVLQRREVPCTRSGVD
jgi:2-methylcitrate dehydratase PrpD